MKIGLFDSGIGGLNVLKEFILKYPNNEYLYYGDTLNVPYGDKDKDTLLKLTSKIIDFFVSKEVDLIIVACGTVSSTCLTELRRKTSIPIFDIISPTIKYLKELKLNKICVFGTKRTIDSHIFKNNVNNIVEIATPEFVLMLENNNIDLDIIKNYIDKIKDYDALVLGCTHYPLLSLEFKKYLNKNCMLINMGKILVNTLDIKNNSKLKIDLYFTKIDDNLKINIDKIIKKAYAIYKI